MDKKAKEVVYYDHFLKTNTSSLEGLVEGIVGYEEDKLQYGHFSPNIDMITVMFKGKKTNVLNSDILDRCENIKYNGTDYTDVYRNSLRSFYKKKSISRDLKSRFEYSVSSESISRVEKHLSVYEFKSIPSFKLVKEALGDLSFGVEFETSSGMIPKHLLLQSGLVPLRDGSIDGLEYVTIPLSGDKGITLLNNAIKNINEFTTVDSRCALHYHFGNVPRTEKFITALWLVICNIQMQLFSLEPPYKILNYGFKSKNYSEVLPACVLASFIKGNTKHNFEQIFQHLSMGITYSSYGNRLENIKSHPSDPDGRHKWNIRPRYSIVNFIPLIFGNKKTVEFRLHETTINPSFIFNSLMLDAIIVNYVIKNQDKIIENPSSANHINIYNIIENSKLSSALKDKMYAYIEYRTGVVNKLFQEGQVFMDFSKYTRLNEEYSKHPIVQLIVGNKKKAIEVYKEESSSGNKGYSTHTFSTRSGLDPTRVVRSEDERDRVDATQNINSMVNGFSRILRFSRNSTVSSMIDEFSIMGMYFHILRNLEIELVSAIDANTSINNNAIAIELGLNLTTLQNVLQTMLRMGVNSTLNQYMQGVGMMNINTTIARTCMVLGGFYKKLYVEYSRTRHLLVPDNSADISIRESFSSASSGNATIRSRRYQEFLLSLFLYNFNKDVMRYAVFESNTINHKTISPSARTAGFENTTGFRRTYDRIYGRYISLLSVDGGEGFEIVENMPDGIARGIIYKQFQRVGKTLIR